MERTRTTREDLGGPTPGGGLGSMLAGADTGDPVTVCHGTFAEQLPLAGQRIADVRAAYADRFNLDPFCQAVVDGEEVGDDTVLGQGQMLVFMRRAGEKGRPAAVC